MLIVLCKITILLAASLILRAFLKRRTAALRHRVLACGIAATLVLPLLTLVLPAWRTPVLASVMVVPRGRQPIVTHTDSSTIPAMLVNAQDRIPVQELLLVVWALGSLLLLVKLAGGIAMRYRTATSLFDEDYLRMSMSLSPEFGVSQPVRLLLAQHKNAMPVTWGFRNPRIVLPSDACSWPDERRRIVLSHELAHIGRNDWLWQMGAEIVRAVYWFHPLAWVASSLLRRESEQAADDSVITSGVKPSLYATELLEISRTLNDSGLLCPTVLAMAQTSHLERRFISMLNKTTNRRRLSAGASYATTLAAIAVILPLSILQLPGQETPGRFSGSVMDPTKAIIANATIIMSNSKAHRKDMTTSDAAGRFTFTELAAGSYEMQVLQPGFEIYVVPEVHLQAGQETKLEVPMRLGTVRETTGVVGNPDRTQHVGVEAPSVNAVPTRIRIGGNVQAANLISKVNPPYPSAAKAARIQGSVKLQALIAAEGTIESLQVENTEIDPDLAKASVEAVQLWRYKPTLLNGNPVAVSTVISVNFTLLP